MRDTTGKYLVAGGHKRTAVSTLKITKWLGAINSVVSGLGAYRERGFPMNDRTT